MSYNYTTTTSTGHKLNDFVPTYVPHSDYLPSNRITDHNIGQANQWVPLPPFSSATTTNKKDSDTSTPRDPPSSTLTDTSLSEPTKTLKSTNPSPKTNSTAESENTDPSPQIIIYPPLSPSYQLHFTITIMSPASSSHVSSSFDV